jgi:Ca-activated chloride channel homolog
VRVSPAEAQPAPDEAPKASTRVSVGYVLVPFVASDSKGKSLKTLAEGDVELLVDGKRVRTDLFARSDDAPVSFTILLDGSGSMGLLGKMDGARAAVNALLDQRVGGDDFALHVFSDGDVREVVPFTEDAAAIRRAVDAVKPWGKTAFYDALARMPDKSLLGRNGARAIVLLTDGIDNASKLTRDELSDLVENISVPVYPIGLRSPGSLGVPLPGQSPEALVNLEVLGQIARFTGGLLAILDDPVKLAEAVRRIESDLRSQYLIGFSPSGTGPVRYRRIAMRFPGAVRSVRVRAGYRGTEPPLAEREANEKPKKKEKKKG